MRLLLYPLMAILVTNCAAQAGDLKQNISANDCTNVSVSQQVDDCVKRKLQISNRLLSDEFARFKQRAANHYAADAQLAREYVATVEKSQTAWLEFRDLDCRIGAFEIEVATPAYITIVNSCTIQMNSVRIEQLEKLP